MDMRHRCSECNKSFRRLEHLNRHLRSHAQRWNFHCSTCNKSFYRRDALERHEASHGSQNLLRLGARACRNCAAAKTKCSADLPCERCTSRSLDCSYTDETLRQNSYKALNSSQLQEANTTNLYEIPQDTPQRWQPHNGAEPGVNRSVQNTDMNVMPWPQAAMQTEQDSSYVPQNVFSSVNWLAGDGVWDFSTANLPEWSETEMTNDPLLSLLDAKSPEHFSNPVDPAHSYDNSINTSGIQIARGESITHSHASASSQNTLYVDSDKTRPPRVKRQKIVSEMGNRLPIRNEQLQYEFPTLSSLDDYDETPIRKLQIDQPIYDLARSAFRTLCYETTSRPFLSENFPSPTIFEILANRGLERLTQYLPFLHPATLCNDSGIIWNLVGALAGVGAQCIEAERSHEFAVAMHEFVRRSLCQIPNHNYSMGHSHTQLIQAKIANSIGLMYSGDQELLELGKQNHHCLSMICESTYSDVAEDDQFTSQECLNEQWVKWAKRETELRLRLSIWLLDCSWNYQFQMKPLLGLEHANIPLPCPEKLWAADNANVWNLARQDFIATPTDTLLQLIQGLYIRKIFPARISDFGQILLIKTLFHRTWEVERYFCQHLSWWDPSSYDNEEAPQFDPIFPIWPPSHPTYAKWRNATCDCLDVIHWKANATIEMSAGSESPVVLYLHLARVVLLTPVQSMLNFANLVARSGNRQSQFNGRKDRMVMHRWATQDQYKARLGIIHAGVLFWHIRRFSRSAFYEPSAIVLSTLTLWCYSCYAEKTTYSTGVPSRSRTHSPSRDTLVGEGQTDSDNSDTAIPPLMNIDRPADDELVQLFVRQGSCIRANITGVGDILGPNAPKRILSQGQKLLRLTSGWGISRVWTDTLEFLKGG